MYTPDERTLEEVERRFVYQQPKEGQPMRYGELRAAARTFAKQILTTTPQCREQSLALTKLEEAIMWANAAIARNE